MNEYENITARDYIIRNVFVCFFFKQKTAYEMRISDWSSDVCSSDLDRRSSPFRTRSRHDRYPVRQRAVRTLSRLCAVDDHRALAPRSARRAEARSPPPAVGDSRDAARTEPGLQEIGAPPRRRSRQHQNQRRQPGL